MNNNSYNSYNDNNNSNSNNDNIIVGLIFAGLFFTILFVCCINEYKIKKNELQRIKCIEQQQQIERLRYIQQELQNNENLPPIYSETVNKISIPSQ
jgi:hypothetical protein